MYDIFLVSTNNDFSSINTIRKRFPFIRTANSIDHAKTQSETRAPRIGPTRRARRRVRRQQWRRHKQH